MPREGTYVGVSKRMWKRLNGLSDQEIDQLLEHMDIGMVVIDDSPWGRGEKILVLSTEPEAHLKKSLERLGLFRFKEKKRR